MSGTPDLSVATREATSVAAGRDLRTPTHARADVRARPSRWRTAGIAWRHAVADHRARFAGSVLGGLSLLLQPTLMVAVYAIVFSTIMPVRGEQQGPAPYVLFLCWGFFPWLAFSEIVGRGSSALIDHAQVLKKHPLPESVFVAKAAFTGSIALVAYLAVLLPATLLLSPAGATPAWALLPAVLGATVLLAYAVASLLAPLCVFFRDLPHLVAVALPFAMWTAPVVYAPEVLPEWARACQAWHPLTPFLAAIRDVGIEGVAPPAACWGLMAAWCGALLAAGAAVSAALRAELRDAI